MTEQLGVALRNAMIGQFETAVGTSPRLQFRSALPPADITLAALGTLGCEIALPADWLTAPSAGLVGKNGTWSANATASILVQHYRLIDTAGTTCHAQGLVTEAYANSKAYLVGQQVDRGGNCYRCTAAGTSAGTGGPTGQTVGIVDGTVTWAYYQTGTEMQLDNTVLNISQPVTVSTWIRNI